MKRASQYLFGVPVFAAAAFGFMPGAKAEADFDFAKSLMDRSEPSFSTDDMVEHLISQLDQNPATKTDAMLIKATFRRKQAATASVEKRKAYLDEAEALYKKVLEGDKKYKNYDVAEREAATINSARATTMIKAAEELKKTNPAEASKMRKEAIDTLDKIAAGHKALADEKFAKFKPHYDKYKVWNEKENPKGDKPIPKEILTPLGASFDDWVMTDKKYVAVKVEQVECYEDGDGAKKSVGAELIKYCKLRVDGESEIGQIMMNFPVLTSWYNYMLGRTNAALQDEKQAAEAWNEALMVEMNEMAADQQKAMFTIKKFILHDLVKMKMRGKKYSDVEGIMVEAMTEPKLRTLFDEDAGKELLIDYAKALTMPADATSAEYEKAVKKLREGIAKEKTQTRWSNEFSRAIAEILEESRNKPGVRPKLSAPEWYDAARGFFLMGQQEYLKFNELGGVKDRDKNPKVKEQFEKCYNEYQSAVDYYRRAVAEARKEKTDLITRLTIEPKAWFEMGLCYLKMEHYYEAVVVYKAMRDSYLPETRKLWMPDLSKGPMFKYQKPVQAILAELDEAKNGLVPKSGSNILYALDKNVELHNNADDLWNRGLKPKIIVTDGIKDENVKDPDYQLARLDMDLAKGLAASGAKAHSKGDSKGGFDLYGQSAAKYVAAAEKFLKIKTTSPAYELALYQGGTCYTIVQAQYVTGKVSSDQKLNDEKSKETGVKALKAYDDYDAFLKKTPPAADDDKTRREKLAGTILLARNALHSGAGEWEKVISTAEEYIKWEGANPQTDSSKHVALLNKFRAELQLASINLAPKCDPYLDACMKTMRAWRKEKPKENKTFVFMLNALSRRFNIAAFQVDKFIKDAKAESKQTDYTPEMIDKYENKVADIQAERVELIEEADDQEPTMEDYSRLVYLFQKTRRDKQCADVAKKLLEKFDKDNKNCKIPDDPKVWQEMLAKMQQVIKYNDLHKWDQAKKDHAVLVDYMYDTREGLAAGRPEQRPEFDKLNQDMEKAAAQIQTIKNNYKDCQTLDPKYGENGKSLLQVIEEEVDFRRKVLATREVLFNKAIQVAARLEKENPDEAKRYKQTALGQIDILLDKLGDKPEIIIMKVELSISVGDYAEAHKTLNEIRTKEPDDSLNYFKASMKDAQVYKLEGKWKEAAEYPEFIALTIGFDSQRVKDNWPDMKMFLVECYKNGASCPANLKKLLEEKKDEEPKAEEKKEEKKEDAPAPAKAEDKAAPTAPAPAEEKKADDKK